MVHVLHAEQVHVFFRARLPVPHFGAGPESLEVMLVEPRDIPWDDIAFRSTDFTLRRYLEDKAAGREHIISPPSTGTSRNLSLGTDSPPTPGVAQCRPLARVEPPRLPAGAPLRKSHDFCRH